MMTGADDGGAEVFGLGALGAGIGPMPTSWDLEADVVIIGAGATGLPAAIRAADAGASVIVVEANYDVGGHAILSGGNVPLGGGTSAQRKYGIADSPDTVFADLTDWTIVQPNGWPDYRYNDRAIMRAFADHCAATAVSDPDAAVLCRLGHTAGARHACGPADQREVPGDGYARPGDSRPLLRWRIGRGIQPTWAGPLHGPGVHRWHLRRRREPYDMSGNAFRGVPVDYWGKKGAKWLQN